MRTLTVILVLSLCAGCSGKKQRVGNIAQADSIELVQDAASILLSTYPPAKTRLALVQETDDTFGVRLVETLRAHGYAVSEYAKPTKGDKYMSAIKRPDGKPLAYILDYGESGTELRVSLHVGSETLSRLYSARGEGKEAKYIPQGFWTRRESGDEKLN